MAYILFFLFNPFSPGKIEKHDFCDSVNSTNFISITRETQCKSLSTWISLESLSILFKNNF